MADNDKRKKDEGTEDSKESKSESKPGKSGVLPIIIGVVIGIVLLGGGGTFLFMRMNSAGAVEDGEETPAQGPVETNIYFDGFATNIANLAVSDQYDYLYIKYGFDVEVSDSTVISEIVAELPKMTSLAAEVMSNRNYTEICTPQGRDRLAREVMRALNEELESGEVIGVYFHTFVAQ